MMKQLSLLMIFAFAAFTAMAQEVKTNVPVNTGDLNNAESVDVEIKNFEKPVFTQGTAGTMATLDTLTELFDRTDSLQLYTYMDGGNQFLLAGTNNRYVFVGTRYNFTGFATVKGLLVAYGFHRIRGNADTYNALLFYTNVDGLPAGNSIGSAAISSSNISTSGFTHIPFTNHASVQKDFAAMVQVNLSATAGDTVDMVGVLAGNANTGAGEKRAVALKPGTGGNFAPAKIGNDFTNFDADLMILPILEIAATGVQELNLPGLTFKGVAPNPATTHAALQFSLDNAEMVTINVVDMNGRIIKEVVNNRMQAGDHVVNIDVTDLKAGMYFYTIVAGNAKMASKLIVD